MFPQPHHAPAAPAQLPGHGEVTGSVAGEFGQPVAPVATGIPSVEWTTVPEAAIDEYRKAFTSKDEIRSARQRDVSPPADDPASFENGGKLELRVPVSARTDRRHHQRSLCLRKDVAHFASKTDDFPVKPSLIELQVHRLGSAGRFSRELRLGWTIRLPNHSRAASATMDSFSVVISFAFPDTFFRGRDGEKLLRQPELPTDANRINHWDRLTLLTETKLVDNSRNALPV